MEYLVMADTEEEAGSDKYYSEDDTADEREVSLEEGRESSAMLRLASGSPRQRLRRSLLRGYGILLLQAVLFFCVYAPIAYKSAAEDKKSYEQPSMSTFQKGLPASNVPLNGTNNLRIGIAKARWNANIVDALVEGCMKTLLQYGANSSLIEVMEVPGSYELPFAAQRLSGRCDVVICIGVLIKGDTMHFEYIAEAVSKGLMDFQLGVSRPVIFGVLTCLTEEQALQRAGLGPEDNPGHNHGIDWGSTAIEMARLR